jgi:dTDP-4-amino-4,6-dideoxygalactose transaminase
LVQDRQRAADRLTTGLKGLVGLKLPVVSQGNTHVYYVYPMQLDLEQLGVSRAHIVEALEAEGLVGLAGGYANIHLLPMYQQKVAYGSKGFPWNAEFCRQNISYDKGICPVAESLHDSTYLGFEMCLHQLSDMEVSLMVAAFKKVWANISQLKFS